MSMVKTISYGEEEFAPDSLRAYEVFVERLATIERAMQDELDVVVPALFRGTEQALRYRTGALLSDARMVLMDAHRLRDAGQDDDEALRGALAERDWRRR